MYTKLEDSPQTLVSENETGAQADPCTCACKGPTSKKDRQIVAGETLTIQASVYYDINGQLPTDNS